MRFAVGHRCGCGCVRGALVERRHVDLCRQSSALCR
ncbi:putative leader peptide [Streptomyces prasinopilosus]